MHEKEKESKLDRRISQPALESGHGGPLSLGQGRGCGFNHSVTPNRPILNLALPRLIGWLLLLII
jgi:hypothetical protein